MKGESKTVAIIGAGPVGCAFAVHLVDAGHNITIVGRGQRLANLTQNEGILTKKSEQATDISKVAVEAVGSLDTARPWDLILLTITEHQFDEPLITALKACPQKTEILLMFNTFTSLDHYLGLLGTKRCIVGFPGIQASFYEGVLVHRFLSFGQRTIISSPTWRSLFSAADIPCIHEPDMQSWLRTHAVIAMVIQSAAVAAARKNAGLTWAEARLRAGAAREGLTLVQKLRGRIIPKLLYFLVIAAPHFVLCGILWGLTRIPSFRKNPQVPHWGREMLGLMESIIRAAPSDVDIQKIRQLQSKDI